MDILFAPYHIVGDMIEKGGVFVIGIFLCGLLLWTLTIERYWYFSRVLPKQAEEYLSLWRARTDHTSWCARSIRQALISKLNLGMASNQTLLKTLVPLAPLLGLIGTVSGMLKVFESMALLGSADARTMATGVSEAMICTLTGLAVSISGLYPVYYFNHRTSRETELLADHFEF
jgi:biopolymer transport protein ExbB